MTTRSLDASLTNPFRGVTPRPVVFLDIATGITFPTHLYYTDAETALTWNSQTWTAWPIRTPSIEIQDQGEAYSGTIELGDVDGTLRGYIETNGMTLEYARVLYYLTDRTVVEAAGTAALTETLVCESYERGEGYLRLAVRSLFAIASVVEVPLRTMTRSAFPGLPVAS